MVTENLPRTEGVEYRIIEGRPDYAVGDDGSVWSKRSKRFGWRKMKQSVSVAGYCVLSMQPDRRQWKVHQLVAIAFISRAPEGHVVNHKDGVKTNNVPGNLEWVTVGENNSHASRTGLSRQNEGEANHRSTLSDSQVLEIIARLQRGETQLQVARSVGVSAGCIGKYRRGTRRTSCGAVMGELLIVPENRGGNKNYRLRKAGVT